MKQTGLAVSKSVQLDNANAVTTAYENFNIPDWGIFCGKQLLHAYEGGDIKEGAELLEKFLEMIGASAATYTLTVYKEVPDKGIKPSTEPDRSINFNLNKYVRPAAAMGLQPGSVDHSFLLNEYQEKKEKIEEQADYIAELEEELAELKTGGKKEKASVMGSITASLTKGLEDPDTIKFIVNRGADLLQGIFTMVKQTASAPMPATRLAGIPVEYRSKLPADHLQAIDDAVGVLVQQRTDVPQLLQKLAKMAIERPDMFHMYMNMFLGM